MPTREEREYYQAGFADGMAMAHGEKAQRFPIAKYESISPLRKPKRKLSAWNKFVKANSKKPRFVLRSGKLNLKKMGVAFRKTSGYRKKRLAERDKIRAGRRR